MSLTRCRYCEHGNPAGSKFCSACGGALHLPAYLASCPRCGTVNPVKATVCSWCQGQLPGRSKVALAFSSLSAKASRVLPRRPSRVVVGTALLTVIAVLGYYGLREDSPADASQLPVAGGGAVSAPAGISVIGLDAAAATERDAATRAGREPVESQEAKAAPAATARPRATRGGERGPSRQEACTDAAAALGLCAKKPGEEEPPRAQACTEAVAALGLCTPGTTQRRE